jgi:sugar-specific transcriptional regulator TrmB
MNKNGILEKIGFTSQQSLVYKALLELGPVSISHIVRKTGFHRPVVYKVLPFLIERGLVSVMPKGKYKIYVAESPEKLERIFADLEDSFNAEIYKLHEIYEAAGKKPVVTYAEGDAAIKEAFSDVVHSLKKNDAYYRYSSALSLTRQKYVPADYRSIRDRKGLERYVIMDESSKHRMSAKLGKAVKTVPNSYNLFDLNITQIIYGDKFSVIDYNTKTIITIENKMIAEFQKKIFKLLFSKL